MKKTLITAAVAMALGFFSTPTFAKSYVVNGHAASAAEVQHLVAHGFQPGAWTVDDQRGAIYIGRTVSRARLPGSSGAIRSSRPYKAMHGARGRRYALSALAVRSAEVAGRAARSPRLEIWSAGARRCLATAMCCWNSPTNDSDALSCLRRPHSVKVCHPCCHDGSVTSRAICVASRWLSC
jgi:hypothetical protein